MCGFFQFDVIKAFNEEMSRPAVIESPDDLVTGDFTPGSRISIIHQSGTDIRINEAVWWLLLDNQSLKPNYKYASFNTRSDRLNDSRSIAFKPYRESRCLIPATAFVEGSSDKKQYWMIEGEQALLCFGGLLRHWVNKETGEAVCSASIITLPPIMEWEQRQIKSIPLLLPGDDRVISQWLDPDTDLSALDYLIQPVLRQTLKITPIAGARKLQASGPSNILSP